MSKVLGYTNKWLQDTVFRVKTSCQADSKNQDEVACIQASAVGCEWQAPSVLIGHSSALCESRLQCYPRPSPFFLQETDRTIEWLLRNGHGRAAHLQSKIDHVA